MKRLMIIADHSLVVHAIRLALRQTAGFQLVGLVDGRQSAEGHLVELRPDVVLIDDMQDPADALLRIREVRDQAPQAKVLLLTLRMEDEWLEQVFQAGAEAVISKAVHSVALGTLLREVVQGNVVQRHRSEQAAGAPQDCPLTSRELEILRLAAEGYTNGKIAQELWVTEQTVKFHLSNTYRKIGVANRTEASRYAYMNHLMAPDEQLAS